MCRLFLFYLLLVGIIFGGEVHAQVDLTPQMTNKIRGVQYTIDYNIKEKIPTIVYYILYKDKLGNYGRKKFHKDKCTLSADPKDYSYTGYDKGHMQSSASSTSILATWESFDMINMTPQLPSFNRGIWKRTEVFERNNCSPYSYVILGDITKDTVKVNNILVPDIYWKVIYNPTKKQMIGFIIHKNDIGDIKTKAVTVDKIESLIGIDLFYQLDIKVQSELESKIDLIKWKW